ncbi:MAG: polysaccharide deacetylase family protein [Pirellulaceae bacterium]|nr:polysaccharide deacetylase family protein [Pirellulaceae bacterium]
MSADIEDWAQSTLDPEMPIYPRAGTNTEHLLDLVARADCKLTCFVLGKFAEKFPETVRRMVREGHEVASHGYGHVNIYEQTPEQFRNDVRRSKAQLEDLTGQAVVGYRGPCFSLGPAGNWPLEILAEESFLYDSSIFPSPTYRNGRADWPAHPVNVTLPSGRKLVEFPAATLQRFGRVLPVAGGGYHRLLPWPLINWCVQQSLADNGIFTLYCHPYEFDPDEFAHLPLELSWKVRLHQGLGRRTFESKFCKLMSKYPTTTARELLARDWPEFRAASDTAQRQT